MTPRQFSRAIESARRRRYLDGLPTAALWVDVRTFMGGKGAKVSDLLGESPFTSSSGASRSSAPLSKRERYERVKANVARYAATLRAQREAEAAQAEASAVQRVESKSST